MTDGATRPDRRAVVAGHRLPAAEATVLTVLLQTGRPMLVSELIPLLDQPRAHTTVLTLLARLQDRGLVRRDGDGRAHRYRAAGDEQQLAVMALQRVLDSLDDPHAAVLAFVDRLPARLRAGLRRRQRQPPRDS
jgi:predicted transcriptional regulator